MNIFSFLRENRANIFVKKIRKINIILFLDVNIFRKNVNIFSLFFGKNKYFAL